MEKDETHSEQQPISLETILSTGICLCGRKLYKRKGTGPTSRKKTWMILVTECSCGLIWPIKPEKLTYLQRQWLARWNNRVQDGFNFDLERMRKALEGPFTVMSRGLSREEKMKFLLGENDEGLQQQQA